MNKSKQRRKTLAKKILYLCSVCIVLSSYLPLSARVGETEDGMGLEQQAKVTISGKVIDQSGEPLIGVSVKDKNSEAATLTDFDGMYTLEVNANSTLVFTYIGFTSKQIPIKGKQKVDITLEEDTYLMDEVVVVGYGVQKKENLTGAVSSVKIDETLGSRPIVDVGRGLQGAVPGLSVSIPSGEVGSDPIMKIRGQVGSIEGTNSPLILVDNVEIPSIQMINPDDIEEISVLKDAASASIYGSKAAFGVILITTKRGAKTESFNVSYSNNFSWQNPTRNIKMAGIEGLEYTLDAHENRNAAPPAGGFWRVDRTSIARMKEWQQKYGKSVKATDPVLYNRDWYYDGVNKFGMRIYDPKEVMIREWAPTQTHNLSVNGKTGKIAYNVGLGYVQQNGMMKAAKHDDFKRYNASFNLSSEINKYISVRAGAIYSDRNKRYPASASATADPWLYMYRWSRLFPIGVLENGLPLRSSETETANTHTANQQNKYYSITLGTTITPMKGWDIKFDYTYSNQQDVTRSSMPNFTAGDVWYTPTLWKDENANQVYVDDDGNVTTDGGVPAYRFPQSEYTANSYIQKKIHQVDNNVFNIYSTYNLNLGADAQHVFKFMAGSNIIKKNWSTLTARKNGLIDFDNPQFNFADGVERAEESANWESQVGFFGRINYAYDNKYLLEANLRYDAASKFPTKLQWRWFPSFSGGWVLSNESFMKVVEPVLSFSKIRASWGFIGDQSIGNGLYIPTLSGNKTTWLDSGGKQFYEFQTPGAVYEDIKWQNIETLNIGTDLRFYNNKIGVTFDWYQRSTKNMIVEGDALPHTMGTGEPKGNFGNLRTRGWELTVDFNHKFSNGIGVNLMVSVSDATTNITRGPDFMRPEGDRSLATRFRTGGRYGDIYGYETDRLYQKEDFVYDANGNIEKTFIIIDGVQKQTNKLAGDNPVYQTYLEDGNQVILFSPGDVKYKDLNGDGYITPGSSTVGNPGDRKVIGNSTPRYEYAIRLGADYKGFDVSVFLQGVGKRQIWGSGQLAIAGYNAKEGAMPEAIANNYWREDRTDAFYPRAWDLSGSDEGYSMKKQSKYLLDMSYLRIKNITFGYAVPIKALRKIKMQKARIYVSLENFFTFDNLRGLPIDPEAISGQSMFNSDASLNNYNLGRTGTGAPTFKSASFGVQLTF